MIIIVAVLIVIAVIALVLPRFIFQTPTTVPPADEETTGEETEEVAFPLGTVITETLSLQADKEFDFAFEEAKKWREDSLFYGMIARYKDSIARESGKNTYIFFSPSLPQYYWTINVNQGQNAEGRNDYERLIHYREDYFLPEGVNVIPMQYWVLDYIEALEIADDLGGKDIRSTYPDYDVNIFLSAQAGRLLTWDIEYLVEDKNMFSLSINAFNGEVS